MNVSSNSGLKVIDCSLLKDSLYVINKLFQQYGFVHESVWVQLRHNILIFFIMHLL